MVDRNAVFKHRLDCAGTLPGEENIAKGIKRNGQRSSRSELVVFTHLMFSLVEITQRT